MADSWADRWDAEEDYWRHQGLQREVARYHGAFQRAISTLHDWGFDVAPTHQVRFHPEQVRGSEAHYAEKLDILFVEQTQRRSRKDLQTKIEHELLHKWQYDNNSNVYPPHFREAVDTVLTAWAAAREVTAAAPAIVWWPFRDGRRGGGPDVHSPPMEPVNLLDIRNAALMRVAEAEIREHLDRVFEGYGEIDERHGRLSREYMDSGEDDEEMERELRRMKSRKTEMEQENREFMQELADRHRDEIEEMIEPVKRRVAYTKELDPRVHTVGEAMNQLWSHFREDRFDLDGDGVREAVQKAASGGFPMGGRNYPQKMLEWFEQFHDMFLDERDEGESKEDAMWHVMEHARNVFAEERRAAYRSVF